MICSGTVLRVEAAEAPSSHNFQLLEAVVANATVLSLSAQGDLHTRGSISAAGHLSTNGTLSIAGGAILQPARISAGPVVDLSAAPPGVHFSIADDGVLAENRLVLPAGAGRLGPREGQLLLLHNGDAQATTGAASVPPGYTVLFVYDGAAWRDLRVLQSAATTLTGMYFTPMLPHCECWSLLPDNYAS